MPLNKMEIVISSDPMELNQVETFIKEIFVKNSLNTELFFKVMVCVKEAVTNSMMHGNKYSTNKQVRIQSYSCHKFLYFRIIDQGDGFDFLNLPDPTDIENLKKETGRGIYIIKTISNETGFKEKGNVIEFKIDLCGED